MPDISNDPPTPSASQSDEPVGTRGVTSGQPSTDQADAEIKPPASTEPADPPTGGGGTGGGIKDSSGIGE